MPAIKKLKSGDVFGDLTVITREGTDNNGFATWRCRCKCGREKIYRGTTLRQGRVVSCGCSKKKAFNKIILSKLNKIDNKLVSEIKYKIKI